MWLHKRRSFCVGERAVKLCVTWTDAITEQDNVNYFTELTLLIRLQRKIYYETIEDILCRHACESSLMKLKQEALNLCK